MKSFDWIFIICIPLLIYAWAIYLRRPVVEEKNIETIPFEYQRVIVTEANGIGITTGYGGAGKGCIGSWLVLTERDRKQNILCIRSVRVDGKKIKEYTWYRIEHGEFVEEPNFWDDARKENKND